MPADGQERASAQPGSRRGRRSLARLVRWLHTYVALLGFAALTFFSATGITLNHAGYFESAAAVDRAVEGTLDSGWLGADVDRLAIVEHLRHEAGLRGRVVDVTVDEGEILLIFEGPGYTADARVDRATGHYDAFETRLGVVAVLDDLHKGRGTGAAWSWVIDLSAAVLLVSGLSGLWLLWFVRLRRAAGLVVAALGGVALTAVWFVCERT